MVAAARKYHRIVQCPNGSRTPNGGMEALDYVGQGNLGKVLAIRGLRFGPRSSIGKVAGRQPIPATVDYNLWSGPAPVMPLTRQNLHYDWHWHWLYGNGELGNGGIHLLDGCRMAAGGGLPRHVISIAGRFGYDDDGQTPNTQIVYFDYEPAPVLFELRGLPKDKSFLSSAVAGPDFWGKDTMDTSMGISVGKVIHCEGGYKELAGVYDRFQAHLSANGVDLDKTPATMGAMLTFDPGVERFVGEFSPSANRFVSRQYRAPFVVPEKV